MKKGTIITLVVLGVLAIVGGISSHTHHVSITRPRYSEIITPHGSNVRSSRVQIERRLCRRVGITCGK